MEYNKENNILQITLKGIFYVCLCEMLDHNDIENTDMTVLVNDFYNRFEKWTGGLLSEEWMKILAKRAEEYFEEGDKNAN